MSINPSPPRLHQPTESINNEKDTPPGLYPRLQGPSSHLTAHLPLTLPPQGGETTFGHDLLFTRHLRDAVAARLPNVAVEVLVYPKYETRGQLDECVSRFRDW